MSGRVLGQVRCVEKNQDNGQREDKDSEELPYINDLIDSLLHSSLLGGCPQPFSGCTCLSCFCLNQINCFSVCFPTCCCGISLMINFAPAFSVFASWEMHFSLGTKIPCLSPLLIWWARFPAFIQATQVRSLTGIWAISSCHWPFWSKDRVF